MAAPQPNLLQREWSRQELLRALAILVAVLVVMAVLTAVFGFNHTGPGYQLIPDPAGALPF